MPKFSDKSKAQVKTLHPDLRKVIEKAGEIWDFMIIEGHRGKEAQNEAYAKGYSKLKWPNGNHNAFPSNAVDLAPYPLDYKDSPRFVHLAGIVLGVAYMLGIKVRWGGNWDQDYELKDNTFQDLGHIELVNPRPLTTDEKALLKLP